MSNRIPISVSNTSMITGKQHIREICMDPLDYADWRNGELIQNALPYLSPDDREFLMSGCTPEEWDNAFAEDDTERDFELDDKEQSDET